LQTEPRLYTQRQASPSERLVIAPLRYSGEASSGVGYFTCVSVSVGGVFVYGIQNSVRHYEADAAGHVNNAAYLHYLEQAAIKHSAAVGYPLGRYQEMSTLFIVRRHEIEYLRPASPGDVLEVVTWAAEIRGPRAVRAHEVYRHSQAASDAGTVAVPADILLPATHVLAGEPLVRARTEWVYVGLDSGRPLRVPAELIEAFTGTGTTRPVSGYQAPLG
jgi:YbgC/YbaW family acyl-CoA thioester hydrolase